eukprot:9372796-Pyramimonas_sp.AAC.1
MPAVKNPPNLVRPVSTSHILSFCRPDPQHRARLPSRGPRLRRVRTLRPLIAESELAGAPGGRWPPL